MEQSQRLERLLKKAQQSLLTRPLSPWSPMWRSVFEMERLTSTKLPTRVEQSKAITSTSSTGASQTASNTEDKLF